MLSSLILMKVEKNNSSGLKPEFKKIHLNLSFYLKMSFLIIQRPKS